MKVNVVMITYNQQNYVSKAIESVLAQVTDFDFNIIIGEDCSRDNTRSICEMYSAQNEKVILLDSAGSNLGMLHNLIRTINAASAEYIAFCEGDDYWIDKYKLQKQIDFLQQNRDYALVSGCVQKVDSVERSLPDGNNFESAENVESIDIHIRDLLVKNQINMVTVCVRTEIIKTLTQEVATEDIWFAIDLWFWMIIAFNSKIRLFSDKMAAYRIHPKGNSRLNNFLSDRLPLIRYDILNRLHQKKHSILSDSNSIPALVYVYHTLLLSRKIRLREKARLLKQLILKPSLLYLLIRFSSEKGIRRLLHDHK